MSDTQRKENVRRLLARRRKPSWSDRLLPVILIVMVLSLALHVWTLKTLDHVRTQARSHVRELAEQTSSVQREVIQTDIHVNETVPIRASVPVQKQFEVPITTNVRIKEEFDLSFGDMKFPIPLNLNIPIDTTVPIEIEETLEVSTTVDIDMHVPVTVPLSDTILGDRLERLQRSLLEVDRELEDLY